MTKKYFALEESADSLDILIFGDIVKYEWSASATSSFTLANKIKDSTAKNINVHINSYGGEVAEGLAIYNSLKNSKATVTTVCDGCACSAASVVFMAGDKRVMSDASWLMIHNAWTYTQGNAEELRKAADDVEKISEVAANAYKSVMTISEDELKKMLDEETIITAKEALSYGFATEIAQEPATGNAAASARKSILQRLKEPAQFEESEIYDLDKIIKNTVAEMLKQSEPPEPEQEPEPVKREKKPAFFITNFAALMTAANEKGENTQWL